MYKELTGKQHLVYMCCVTSGQLHIDLVTTVVTSIPMKVTDSAFFGSNASHFCHKTQLFTSGDMQLLHIWHVLCQSGTLLNRLATSALKAHLFLPFSGFALNFIQKIPAIK